MVTANKSQEDERQRGRLNIMKKIISLFLCMAMLMALTACGSSEGNANQSTPQSGNSTVSAQDNSGTGNTAAEEAIANRTEPTKLVIYMASYGGAMDAQAEVAEEMNKITRESLNLEIDLQLVDSSTYKQSMTLALSSGEQVDLYNAIFVDYSNSVNNGYVLDMEEDNLIQDYGQGILEILEPKYIEASRFGGKLFGLPTQRDMALGLEGTSIGAQYLDGIGYEYTDANVHYITCDEIEDILARLHEAYPDKNVMKGVSLNFSMIYDALGGGVFGVLLDPVNSLTVEDLFSSDKYMEFCKMMYEWNQLGYISQDALTNDTPNTVEVRSGTLMCSFTATKPGIRSQMTKLNGMESVVFQWGEDYLSSGAVSGIPWCIGYTTVDKVAAMQYLNELYTNPGLSRLLCWGREGEEWVEMEDGHLTYPEGIDAETSAYSHGMNWETPNQFIAGVWEGDPLDIWEEMEEFNNNALTSKALGFSFDNTSVINEFTALTNIYNEYQKQLEMGFLDPEKGIPEMVQRMKDSGLDKYMAEKQAQLDEWAKLNGVS